MKNLIKRTTRYVDNEKKETKLEINLLGSLALITDIGLIICILLCIILFS